MITTHSRYKNPHKYVFIFSDVLTKLAAKTNASQNGARTLSMILNSPEKNARKLTAENWRRLTNNTNYELTDRTNVKRLTDYTAREVGTTRPLV